MAYSGLGTGTQADPYQVTTLYQLLEVFDIYNNEEGVSGQALDVYCKLMNDIDFNDYPEYWDCPENMFYANNRRKLAHQDIWNSIHINGNNHGMYNIYTFNKINVFGFYSSGSSEQNHILISNCIIEAVVLYTIEARFGSFIATNTGTYSSSYNSGVFFDNCDMRIKYYRYASSTSYSKLFNYTRFRNCIINIDLIVNADAYNGNSNSREAILASLNSDTSYYAQYYNEWNIKVIALAGNLNYAIALFGGNAHFFSSFFIEFLAKADNCKFTFNSNGGQDRINNCYLVVTNKHTTYKATMTFNFIKNGVNFYDNQVNSGYITDSSTGNGQLYALTTSQCKDAEYLESVGFIIAR